MSVWNLLLVQLTHWVLVFRRQMTTGMMKDQVSPEGVPNQNADSPMDEMRGLGNSCSELDGKRKQSTLDLRCGPNVVRLEDDHSEPIAIIGFSARLPQDAATTEEFWKMLCEGRSTRTEIPKDRFNIDAFYHPDPDRVDTVSRTLVAPSSLTTTLLKAHQ